MNLLIDIINYVVELGIGRGKGLIYSGTTVLHLHFNYKSFWSFHSARFIYYCRYLLYLLFFIQLSLLYTQNVYSQCILRTS